MSNPQPSRSLTYQGEIRREDLFLRVLGPDEFGGQYYVWQVVYEPSVDKTRAYVRPLHGQALRLTYWDQDKQPWLHHSAIDGEGLLVSA